MARSTASVRVRLDWRRMLAFDQLVQESRVADPSQLVKIGSKNPRPEGPARAETVDRSA